MAESHLGNDNTNITKRSFKAAGWVLIVKFASQFIQVFLEICLLRLLTPYDYGIIGILTLFWSISYVFIQGGFGQALIQRKEVTEIDLCSVFYYNIFLSLVCFGLLIGFAEKIALFYNEPVLEKTIYVTAWTLPISALVSVQIALLDRRLKQFFVTVSTLASHLIASVIAIFIARGGYGLWAIVWQQLIATSLSAVSVFWFARWIPKLRFSFRALGSLFAFGSKLLLIEILNVFTTHFSNLIIGKKYPTSELGIYTRAKKYAHLWPTSVQGAVGRVLFPAFSKIQDDLPRLRNAFSRSLAVSTFAVVFLPFLICTLSRPFITLVLGEKWLDCIPYWWLITLTVIFYPIQVLNMQLLKARGRSDLYLLLEIIKKSFFAVQVAILLLYGIVPMLIGEIFFSFVGVYLNSYFTGRDLKYGLFRQLGDIFPYAAITVPSCLFAWELYHLISPHSPWFGLILPGLAGVLLYVALNRLFRTPALGELVKLLGGRFPAVKKALFY